MNLRPPEKVVRWYAESIQCRDTLFTRGVRRCVIVPLLKLTCARGPGFYQPDAVPQLKQLERHHEAIREECLRLVRDGGVRVFRELLINPQRKWKQFSFYRPGRDDVMEAGRRHLPTTSAVFADCAASLQIGGAVVTVLESGGRILPHADLGMDPKFLRFHFGVDVPAGCGITVARETRTWREAGWLVLDERKLHSCFNDGDRPRIVIAADVAVPQHLRVPAGPADAGAGCF